MFNFYFIVYFIFCFQCCVEFGCHKKMISAVVCLVITLILIYYGHVATSKFTKEL